MEKICRICNIPKDIEEFAKNKRNLDGHSTMCKPCNNTWYKNTYKPNNLDKIQKYCKEYHIKNAEEICKKSKKWKENNEVYYEKQRIYTDKNKGISNQKAKDKYHTIQRLDPFFMLSSSMRSNINNSLKRVGGKEGAHWETVGGCDLTGLPLHLESLFEEGMTWKNYGRNSGAKWWEVGHRIPIKAFKFLSPTDEEFHLCWSLRNLFPQWRFENGKISDKVYIEGKWKSARYLSESERLLVINRLRDSTAVVDYLYLVRS